MRRADPNLSAGKKPGDLKVTRMKGREVRLKTVRGQVRCSREYLHFPELKLGIFPLTARLEIPESKLSARLEQHLL